LKAGALTVLPDILLVSTILRPVWVQSKIKGVCVARNVTAGSRVFVLEPSASNVCVFVIHDQFGVLEALLDFVCHHDP
jgi:hypothetical protein